MAESVHYIRHRLHWNPWTDLPDSSTDHAPGAPSCSGCLLDEPWSVRLEDEAPLSVTAVVRGHLWVCLDGEEPTRLEAGDVVVWVGSDHWTIADDPRRRPRS